jgi:hypothetical protein
MNNQFEFLDALISSLEYYPIFSNDAPFKKMFLITEGSTPHFRTGFYPDEKSNKKAMLTNCIREIDIYFDHNEANKNNSYSAIMLRMHRLGLLLNGTNITKIKGLLIKLENENLSEFSIKGHCALIEILVAEDSLKYITTRFNLLKIDIYNINNAIEEAFIEIDISRPTETVMFLEKLGIFDFLKKEISTISNNQLGQIFGQITNIKPETFSRALDRLRVSDPTAKTEKKIQKIFKKLNIPIKEK